MHYHHRNVCFGLFVVAAYGVLKQPHQPPPISMSIRQSFRDGIQREVLLINFLCYFRFGKQSELITLFALYYALTPFFHALPESMTLQIARHHLPSGPYGLIPLGLHSHLGPHTHLSQQGRPPIAAPPPRQDRRPRRLQDAVAIIRGSSCCWGWFSFSVA
jgi:hypothetical protein